MGEKSIEKKGARYSEDSKTIPIILAPVKSEIILVSIDFMDEEMSLFGREANSTKTLKLVSYLMESLGFPATVYMFTLHIQRKHP